MCKLKAKAQSLVEYALCLAVVMGALVSLQTYLQRSTQARSKDGADYVISQIEKEATDRGIPNLTNLGRQYDPYYQESSITEIKGTETKNNVSIVGFPDSSTDETITRSGWQKQGSAIGAD